MNESYMHLIQEYNKELAKDLWLTTLLCILCLVIGLFGNGSVFWIYLFKLPTKRESRYFIPYLAIADALSIIFSSISFTYGNFNMLYFPYDYLCKLAVFVCFVPGIASPCFRLAIAVQRFTVTMNRHYSLNWRRVTAVVIWIVSVCVSFPYLFIAGVGEIRDTYKDVNLTSDKCNIYNKDSTYSIFVLVVIILIIVITFGLFAYKAVEVYRRQKASSKAPQANDTNKLLSQTVQSVSDSTRFNWMFFIIVVANVSSYVPTIIMALMNKSDLSSRGDASVSNLQVYGFFTRFFIINHVVNTFIYAYFDIEYRKYMKRLLCFWRR